ncbi:uncharacterized protein VTP21DRAFT_953 [Calcarisporiella thermophila]|uniref:uncharacterized protein n=1 Tax=Calcarisporiella thermophila TaxID=911321 RepID=UPI0037428853
MARPHAPNPAHKPQTQTNLLISACMTRRGERGAPPGRRPPSSPNAWARPAGSDGKASLGILQQARFVMRGGRVWPRKRKDPLFLWLAGIRHARQSSGPQIGPRGTGQGGAGGGGRAAQEGALAIPKGKWYKGQIWAQVDPTISNLLDARATSSAWGTGCRVTEHASSGAEAGLEPRRVGHAACHEAAEGERTLRPNLGGEAPSRSPPPSISGQFFAARTLCARGPARTGDHVGTLAIIKPCGLALALYTETRSSVGASVLGLWPYTGSHPKVQVEKCLVRGSLAQAPALTASHVAAVTGPFNRARHRTGSGPSTLSAAVCPAGLALAGSGRPPPPGPCLAQRPQALTLLHGADSERKSLGWPSPPPPGSGPFPSLPALVCSPPPAVLRPPLGYACRHRP